MAIFGDKKKKNLTPKEAKLKAADYCSYQERSQKEVRNKLYEYGLFKDDVEDVLTELVINGFINEERFAKAYVGGKFRMKQWGRVKILQGLSHHNISQYCINKGLEEIDEQDYLSLARELIEKKSRAITDDNDYIRNRKIANYLLQKGFEGDIVWSIINEG